MGVEILVAAPFACRYPHAIRANAYRYVVYAVAWVHASRDPRI